MPIVRTLLCSLLAVGSMASAAEGAKPKPRIVDCDEQVQSRKRGICLNKFDDADFKVVAPGVSWWYNWYHDWKTPPSGVAMEFIPMVWGSGAERMTGLEKYLAAGHKPRAVFAINEPNLKGQAFITPEETATAFTRIAEIAGRYKIEVVGPHMAIGSAPDASITAEDPIEKKSMTYGFMNPYLKAFLHYTDKAKTEVPAMGVHSYKDLGELKWVVDMMYKEFKRPVWVTEYAWWNAPNEKAARDYLIQATDFLERHPHVAGYAWFKERSDRKVISLLTPKSGELSTLGEAYVAMPVHDADVFYRIPGTLQAENYTAIEAADLKDTDDADGFLHLVSGGNKTSADYQVQVDKAGQFAVVFRVSGKKDDRLTLSANGRDLATVRLADGGWQSVGALIDLPKGLQRLHLAIAAKGVEVNWIGFSAK